MFGMGPMELVVILAIGILVLGPKKTVEAARTTGKFIGETRKAISEAAEALNVEE
jgi:sec-independent protein translocase protein TatB